MKIDRKKKFYIFILGFLGCVVLPFLISVGSAPLGSEFSKWISGSLKLITICSILGLLLFLILFYCFDQYTKLLNRGAVSQDIRRRDELVNGLRIRYENRLAKRMDEEINFQLQLTLKYTKEGVDAEYIKTFYVKNYEDKVIKHIGPLFEDFAIEIHHLLILGDPGSGKTVLLLNFAQFFLEKSIEDTDYPVPVIVNLASWRSTYETFESWLEENLIRAAGEYGTSKKYAKKMVDEANFLLLLDGLDEVPIEHRKSCLEKLDIMISKNTSHRRTWLKYPHVIICSRTVEFLSVKHKAPVNATIQIEPLDSLYVKDCLQELAMEGVKSAKMLVSRITDQPLILTQLTTAFAVHLALHLAEKYDFETYSINDLLSSYCELQVNEVRGYSTKKTIQYLHHLAYFLSETKNIVIFELIDIQPVWLTINSKSLYLLKGRAKLFRGKHAYRIMLEIFRTGLVGAIIWFVMFIPFLIIQDKSMEVSIRIVVPIAVAVLIGIPFGIVFTIINGFFFRKELVLREILQFRPAEFSVVKFINLFRKTSIRTAIIIELIAMAGGLIAGFTNNSIANSNGWKANLYASWESGKGHYMDGLTLSVLPVYLHSIIITIIFAYTLYQGFFGTRKASSDTDNGALFTKLSAFANRFFDFAWQFVIVWLSQGVVIGFCYGLALGPWSGFFFIFFQFLVGGVYAGVAFGLIIGIYSGLIESLFTSRSSIRIYKPYRRFLLASVFDFFRLSIPLTAIALIIISISLPGKNFSSLHVSWAFLAIATIQVLSLIVCIYKSPLVNSLAIRFMLYIQGKIPLRYKHFLDKVAKTGLMERDGGQWRFRHQMIQDLFAK